MTSWLITGGAGYIGSHVVVALRNAGRDVVVFDDFSSGLERRLIEGVPLVRGSVLDVTTLATAMREHNIDGVVHLAAKKAAPESIDIPLHYYRENVDGLLTVLEAMQQEGVTRLVYSSSAAVYGTPASNPISEDAPMHPESPYGETKVIGEWLTAACGNAWDLSWAALRYFNVAGAGSDALADSSVNNLVPMVFQALDQGRRPQIFGDDYPSPDGTCIRDFVHVSDLAEAHVVAAIELEHDRTVGPLNVGRGIGCTVREMMDVMGDVIGRDLNPEVVGRRAGDPMASYASTARIEGEYGWRASRDLRQMVDSAWSGWRANNPL